MKKWEEQKRKEKSNTRLVMLMLNTKHWERENTPPSPGKKKRTETISIQYRRSITKKSNIQINEVIILIYPSAVDIVLHDITPLIISLAVLPRSLLNNRKQEEKNVSKIDSFPISDMIFPDILFSQ